MAETAGAPSCGTCPRCCPWRCRRCHDPRGPSRTPEEPGPRQRRGAARRRRYAGHPARDTRRAGGPVPDAAWDDPRPAQRAAPAVRPLLRVRTGSVQRVAGLAAARAGAQWGGAVPRDRCDGRRVAGYRTAGTVIDSSHANGSERVRDGMATQPPPPNRDIAVPRTRTAWIWIASILFAVVLLLLLIFILQNGQRARISFFGAHANPPVGVALLLAAVFGILLVALPGTARILQLRLLARRRSLAASVEPTAPPATPDEPPVAPVERTAAPVERVAPVEPPPGPASAAPPAPQPAAPEAPSPAAPPAPQPAAPPPAPRPP